MPTLSYVHPWPAQARADRPTHEDDVADIAIRGSRSVTELYSEALAELDLTNRVSELRLFINHDPAGQDVRGVVGVDPVHEGFEMGHISVPTAFSDRTARTRALMLLDVIHRLVDRLAIARGWDRAALESCRQHVLDSGLEYRWRSPRKASPDRQHEAYADYRLAADGYGRVTLSLVRRVDDATVASSDEALAFCTGAGFRRSADSLRWEGKDSVSLVPYDWVPAVRGGEVRLVRHDGSWHGSVTDYMTVRSVPEGNPGLPPLLIHVEGRGASAREQPPIATFVGGGPIQNERVAQFHEAFSAQMARFTSPLGQSWWSGAGLRLLEIQIYYNRDQAQVRGRQSEQRLRIFVHQPDSPLMDSDPASLAKEVAENVVALVRRRTGLEPHPEFT